MVSIWTISSLLWIITTTYALPQLVQYNRNNHTRPFVVWHGLGDSYASNGMVQFMDIIRQLYPSIFVHSIYVAKDQDDDQKAGWFGDITVQLPAVAEQLAGIPELQGGFDAFGFSQGGQFLRAYAEIYNDPPVYNLVTFGSQHMGVAETPACSGTFDLLCRAAKLAASSRGIYSNWVQTNIIPAQYYRDPAQLPAYLTANRFLTSINNEIPETRNATYAKNLASLSNLVLVLFTEDETVIPKESSWFGSYAPPNGTDATLSDPDTKIIIPMKRQPLYNEDWIGLKQLDLDGKVKFVSCEGRHMHISKECLEPLLKQYVGGQTMDNLTGSLLVQ